jgi:hypothetical protein
MAKITLEISDELFEQLLLLQLNNSDRIQER